MTAKQQNRMDVRFRMLTPRELAAAQSFPGDYTFTGTREEVVKQPPQKTKGQVSAVIPVAKRPVRIHFMKGNYVKEHLYFLCQCYRPHGANPKYPDDRKYRGDSQMCDGCFTFADGVRFKAPFHCSRENRGGEYHIYRSLFNPNPLDHVDKNERQQIAAGLKLLWKVPA